MLGPKAVKGVPHTDAYGFIFIVFDVMNQPVGHYWSKYSLLMKPGYICAHWKQICTP